ncbi:hypothetical protein RFX30_20770, partial [Acinetobacter baumannii]|nr:hypothetical protein [Acinetobacter baumannii]
MNRKLTRLLRPGMGIYFIVMALFCAAALLRGHYWLAAVETGVTLVLFVLYLLGRSRRGRMIQ